MSTSIRKAKKPSQRGYHHGNLRQALLNAALVLIEGGKELSLRTVAASAGVSSAAPYRHFEDREALLAAVATIGFDRLLEAISTVRPVAKDGPKLTAMLLAYLNFAAENKGLYQLMFAENHFAMRFDEGLAKSSMAAFLELENAVSSRLVHPENGHAKLIATTLWASMHGVAMLSFERLIPAGGPSDSAQAQKVSTAVLHLLIKSLFKPAS